MNEQVLVIDDEQDAVDSIVEGLALQGISSRGDTSPQTAIESFQASPTDVVIVDYVFPASTGVTGVDIIAQLKAIKPFTKFILISAWIDKDLDENTLTDELRNKLQGHRYLPKPIDIDKLIASVKEALEMTQTESSDWKSIAQQYVNQGAVNAEEVRQLNEKIKEHLIKAIDTKAEE
ncbi:MAG TPA: response regulator [Blastocatellia bacterium]|nr:response regulator [Blastocatellia bacterium]